MSQRKKHLKKRPSEDEILIKSAKIASSKARRTSYALGLTVKVIKGDKIITIAPDKTEKVLRQLDRPTVDLSKLKKGSVLERNSNV